MQLIEAVSITRYARKWLGDSYRSRILHIFKSACNLINERGEVVSIVASSIGNGPFNLVVEPRIDFTDHIEPDISIGASHNELTLGDLTVRIANAKIWNPCPNWELLHEKRYGIADQLKILPSQSPPPSITQYHHSFTASLVNADIPSSTAIARQLAGLGMGLTPSGDDFLTGALHAEWIVHPHEVASILAREIADAAAPRTTSLSAAWIRAAARGEAGEIWHIFFDMLSDGNEADIRRSYDKILAVGETSGADALAGFMETLTPRADPEDSSSDQFHRKDATSGL